MEFTMENRLKGCGKYDGPRTLYLVKHDAPPIPLNASYWHIRCGYRPPSKIQNGILLCNECIVLLRLPILGNSSHAI